MDHRESAHAASKETFHCPDLWHSLLLGVGKSWSASSIMYLAALLDGGTKLEQFAELSRLYTLFCKVPWPCLACGFCPFFLRAQKRGQQTSCFQQVVSTHPSRSPVSFLARTANEPNN